MGSCECVNELSGSIKCSEFLNQLKTCKLLRKESAPWSKCSYAGCKKINLSRALHGGTNGKCGYTFTHSQPRAKC